MHRILSLCAACSLGILMSSCSTSSLCSSWSDSSHAEASWFRCGKDAEGNRLFYTNVRVSVEFPEEFGTWKAYGIHDKKLYMEARGKTFCIEKNYGWDGATNAPTTRSLLLPTLFHDALLHAMMNGAPVSRKQADLAFYQLMKRERFPLAAAYYRSVRNFGSSFVPKQNPPTLKIISR